MSNVQVDRDDYVVNASIDDEYMYTDTGELKLVNTIDKMIFLILNQAFTMFIIALFPKIKIK